MRAVRGGSFASLRMTARVGLALLLLAPSLVSADAATEPPSATTLDARARQPATRVELAPAPDGTLGAWLLLGPYPLPAGGDAPLTVPPPGQVDPPDGKHWTLASSSEGPIDVKAALHPKGGEAVAFAAGTLHVEQKGRYLLMLGADDGVTVYVDDKKVFARDESRPQRDDDDMVPMDLTPGDHALLLRLHQHDAGWAFKARVLDAHLDPPEGGYLALPGTTLDDARLLVEKLSWVSVDRGLTGAHPEYRPSLVVRFPEGAPRGVPLTTSVRLVDKRDGAVRMDVPAGEVPLDGRGVGELDVTLPFSREKDGPIDDRDLTYEVRVGGRLVKAAFSPRKRIHEAVLHLTAALEASTPKDAWLQSGSYDTAVYLRDRLLSFASHSDGDLEAQVEDAKELEAIAKDMGEHQDPFARRTGPMRRALLSPFDGKPAPFGLYVPASYRPGSARRYPLIVGLHGLNGRPYAMIRYLFGNDDPDKPNEWEDRHLGPLPPLDAFVITPSGYGNTMYRDLGEDDTLQLLAWVLGRYPIDPDRVSITGMSMGGIGAASIPLKHPGIFAAAEPLCGYHSYFVRRDITGHPLRPWETFLAAERSNVFWAENGQHLPLYIVHGTLDQPEANSGVLIKRYEDLGYSVEHEHPKLGHNVWQTTYEDLKGAKWLLQRVRDAHPREVRLRTMRLRDGDDAWVHLTELAAPDQWGEVVARGAGPGAITVKTSGVRELRLDRDSDVTGSGGRLKVSIDGARLVFEDGVAPVMHRSVGSDGTPGEWAPGPADHAGIAKRGEVTGPIRDVFHEPILFVYGASDPTQTRANEEVARAWAAIRWGVTVQYPVMSDVEFLERGQALANDKALFLVGNAASNQVTRALDDKLPIHVEGGAVVMGKERFEGEEVGAAFIRPNPLRPERYVVVVEGVDARGTWRSLSLPDLIPDFVVYDQSVASARGQMILGSGAVRAGGFFDNEWALPKNTGDPLVQAQRPGAKTEYEATPYLP
jgi:predicted esterase